MWYQGQKTVKIPQRLAGAEADRVKNLSFHSNSHLRSNNTIIKGGPIRQPLLSCSLTNQFHKTLKSTRLNCYVTVLWTSLLIFMLKTFRSTLLKRHGLTNPKIHGWGSQIGITTKEQDNLLNDSLELTGQTIHSTFIGSTSWIKSEETLKIVLNTLSDVLTKSDRIGLGVTKNIKPGGAINFVVGYYLFLKIDHLSLRFNGLMSQMSATLGLWSNRFKMQLRRLTRLWTLSMTSIKRRKSWDRRHLS